MGMKYYKIGDVPFATNAIPPEEAVEIDKVEHDRLAKASIKPEPVYEPVPDPLKIEIAGLRIRIEALEKSSKG